ncbi:hypothetical protein LEP1GSC050_2051 [Leptospira broomii serovar Hurstbridge str. 5399]|uniref:Uncharacterized protein n=1 Tax=Leptospira broomii serovar Hurstbridge str. 5399 TaxID=1049789 RepID=T0GG04_9LEPT|nr:hypothetical protein LEP1GSC050_2051 [Leptospira broomii serovar Hurstbridge str. 5399]
MLRYFFLVSKLIRWKYFRLRRLTLRAALAIEGNLNGNSEDWKEDYEFSIKII